MIIIFCYALLGVIVSTALGIGILNKSTPQLTPQEALSEYFRINIWNLVAGVPLIFVVVAVSLTDDTALLQVMNIDPVLSIGGGFLLGFAVMSVTNKVMGLLGGKVPEVKTTGECVKTVSKTQNPL